MSFFLRGGSLQALYEAAERISRVWRDGLRQIANTEHGLLRARRERSRRSAAE